VAGYISALPSSSLLGVYLIRRRQLAIGRTKNLTAVAGYISALPASDLLDVYLMRRRQLAIGRTKNLAAVAGYFPPCYRQTRYAADKRP